MLYPAHHKNFSLNYQQIELLLNDLSPGGRRSLLHHLEKEGYILRENLLGQSWITITGQGKRQCKRLFPAFSDHWQAWQGEWELLVFLSAPKNDPQFRYLRNLLLEERAVFLSRGVYAVPGKLSEKVLAVVESLYQRAVAVFAISEWKFGSEQEIVIEQLGLTDIIEAYSGISREIRELLENCDKNVRLTNQQKLLFIPVFDRFWENVTMDTGFARYYVPNAPTAADMLSQLQKLLFCMYADNNSLI